MTTPKPCSQRQDFTDAEPQAELTSRTSRKNSKQFCMFSLFVSKLKTEALQRILLQNNIILRRFLRRANIRLLSLFHLHTKIKVQRNIVLNPYSTSFLRLWDCHNISDKNFAFLVLLLYSRAHFNIIIHACMSCGYSLIKLSCFVCELNAQLNKKLALAHMSYTNSNAIQATNNVQNVRFTLYCISIDCTIFN